MEWDTRDVYMWSDVATFRDHDVEIFVSIIFLTPWQVFRLLLIWMCLRIVNKAVSLSFSLSFIHFALLPLSQSSNIIQCSAKNHLLYRASQQNEQNEGKVTLKNCNFPASNWSFPSQVRIIRLKSELSASNHELVLSPSELTSVLVKVSTYLQLLYEIYRGVFVFQFCWLLSTTTFRSPATGKHKKFISFSNYWRGSLFKITSVIGVYETNDDVPVK